jgi:hypothetical protein
MQTDKPSVLTRVTRNRSRAHVKQSKGRDPARAGTARL